CASSCILLCAVNLFSYICPRFSFAFFFFNPPPTPEIYTLSLHDALPISLRRARTGERAQGGFSMIEVQMAILILTVISLASWGRSEEHTSELQSHLNLVCRLLLEKKKCETKTSRSTRKSALSTRIVTRTG